MCAKTTIGVLADLALQIVFEPRELLGAEIAEAAGLEIDDIDQADEVHAVIVEAVPARAFRSLAVTVEIGLAARFIDDVVLAGNVVDLQPGFAEHLSALSNSLASTDA